jgi:hypothetical protein
LTLSPELEPVTWIEGTRIVHDGHVSVSRSRVCKAGKLPGPLA